MRCIERKTNETEHTHLDNSDSCKLHRNMTEENSSWTKLVIQQTKNCQSGKQSWVSTDGPLVKGLAKLSGPLRKSKKRHHNCKNTSNCTFRKMARATRIVVTVETNIRSVKTWDTRGASDKDIRALMHRKATTKSNPTERATPEANRIPRGRVSPRARAKEQDVGMDRKVTAITIAMLLENITIWIESTFCVIPKHVAEGCTALAESMKKRTKKILFDTNPTCFAVYGLHELIFRLILLGRVTLWSCSHDLTATSFLHCS